MFRVLPWEKKFVRGAFAVEGPAAISVARGNGKSALVAGIEAAVALIVERNHPLGGAAQVGDNEPDPRVQLTRMPLDLGDDAAGLVPGSGLITEAGMIPAHVLGRPADGALQGVLST